MASTTLTTTKRATPGGIMATLIKAGIPYAPAPFPDPRSTEGFQIFKPLRSLFGETHIVAHYNNLYGLCTEPEGIAVEVRRHNEYAAILQAAYPGLQVLRIEQGGIYLKLV